MSRDSAKAHYTKQPGDPDEGFITASDAQAAIDDIYDDMAAPATIADGSVTAGKIAADAVGSTKIASGAVGESELAADAVTNDKIADGAVKNAQVAADAAIDKSKISGVAVTQGDTGTVTNAMLAGSIAASKVAGTAVTQADTGTVTGTMIGTGAVGNGNLAANAVNAAKIASGAVDATKIADGAVTTAKIANDAVTSAQIAADAVGASELADNAVDTAAIAADAVTADKIANDTITAAELAPNSVGTSEIANDAVTSAKILSGAISGDKILDGSITAGKIADDTITATQIAANAVGSSELADNAVDTAAIADSAVTSAKIADGSIVNTDISATAAIDGSKIARIGSHLTPNQASVETDTTGWSSASGSSVTLARTTAQALHGSACLQITTTTTNAAWSTPSGTGGPAVLPSKTYTAVASIKTASTSPTMRITLQWFTSGGSLISTVGAPYVSVNASGWTELRLTATAPSNAAYVCMGINIPGGTASIGDVYYMDAAGLWQGAGGQWQMPGAVIPGLLPFANTKGALAVGSGAAAMASELTVGADGSALVADSSAATGVKWGQVTAAGLDAAALGSDITLTTGSPNDTITSPNSGTETFGAAYFGIRQHLAAYRGGQVVQDGNDDIGPIWVQLDGSSVTEILCGNHRPKTWRIAQGSLTSADIGKVWQSGSDRVTLLDIATSYAYFSLVHDTSNVPLGSTPSGTWTCTVTGPDVVLTGATEITGTIHLNRSYTYDGFNWSDGAVRGTLLRRYTWDTTSLSRYLTAQQASVGAKIDPAAATSIGQYVTEWRWPSNQGGATIIDTTYTAAVAQVLVNFSGLQMLGGGTHAVLGLESGNVLSGWTTSNSDGGAVPADWVDGIYPPAFFTRNSAGGGACGFFASSIDPGTIDDAGGVRNSKLYPTVAGTAAAVALSPGDTLYSRGWRSYVGTDSDRHVHVVTDPLTGVTHWFLMAGSTGVAPQDALVRHTGRRLVKTRGTAEVDGYVGNGQIVVTTSGWAQGTIT